MDTNTSAQDNGIGDWQLVIEQLTENRRDMARFAEKSELSVNDLIAMAINTLEMLYVVGNDISSQEQGFVSLTKRKQ